MDKIGTRIKELRLSKGMTLEELGDKVGVGKSTVRKWEVGAISNMRRDKILKVAEALDVTPSYLLGYEQEEMKKKLEAIRNRPGMTIGSDSGTRTNGITFSKEAIVELFKDKFKTNYLGDSKEDKLLLRKFNNLSEEEVDFVLFYLQLSDEDKDKIKQLAEISGIGKK